MPLSEADTRAKLISRQRVEVHGDVPTGEREVNAMLDLVWLKTERIAARFLEPACGSGNFLTAILERKLAAVEKKYRKSQPEYERYAVIAVSAIYGIDILPDNVEECQKRLFDIFDCSYTRLFQDKTKDKCREAVRFILDRNVIWGDALTLKTVGENPGPIVFSEWSMLNSQLARRDFTFRELLAPTAPVPITSDIGKQVFLPEPEREFPKVHFLEISRV